MLQYTIAEQNALFFSKYFGIEKHFTHERTSRMQTILPPPPPLLQKNQCKINNQRKSTVRRNNIYFQHFTEASERVRKCEKSTTKKKRRFFLPLHHMPVYSSICIFRLENVFRVPVQAHSLNLSRLHIYWVRDNSQR